jgi:hypothetical protein
MNTGSGVNKTALGNSFERNQSNDHQARESLFDFEMLD